MNVITMAILRQLHSGLLSLCLLACFLFVSSQQQQIGFLNAPEDTETLNGQDVTFHCTVLHLERTHFVLWYRGNMPLTNGSHVLREPHRYVVKGNPPLGQYDLEIRDVSLSDDANYFCVVHQAGREFPVLSSDPARLEILSIPDEKYPTCKPLEKATYKVGERIRLTCKSERGNPPVMLTWNRANRAIHSKVTQDDTVIGYRHLHYDTTITAADHDATFQCKMTTTAAKVTIQRSCSLGPLDVLYKPQVSVQASPKTAVAEETVSLFCDVSANPAPRQYKWSFSKPIDPNQLTYSRNNQQLEIAAAVANNKTTITCNATNSEGSALAHFTLIVMDPNSVDSTSNPTLLLNGATKPPKAASPDDTFDLKPEVLAVIAGTLALIVLVLILLILVTCRCTLQQNKSSPPPPPHPVIYGAPELFYDQGSVYFEPKDRISIRDMPTLMRPAPWHRTVGVQVPYVEDEDSTYEEIGQDWDEGTVELRI